MTNLLQCSWAGCEQLAKHRQLSKDGDEWANLCDEHNLAIDESIDKALENGDVKSLLSGWVKAQGGAKAATKRMMGGFNDLD